MNQDEGERVILKDQRTTTVLDFVRPRTYDGGSSLVVPIFIDKLLLVFNTDRKGWEFPGGKRETGETPLDCAERELLEETGMTGGNFIWRCYYRVKRENFIMDGDIFSCKLSSFSPAFLDSKVSGAGLFSTCPANLAITDGYIEYFFSISKSLF